MPYLSFRTDELASTDEVCARLVALSHPRPAGPASFDGSFDGRVFAGWRRSSFRNPFVADIYGRVVPDEKGAHADFTLVVWPVGLFVMLLLLGLVGAVLLVSSPAWRQAHPMLLTLPCIGLGFACVSFYADALISKRMLVRALRAGPNNWSKPTPLRGAA